MTDKLTNKDVVFELMKTSLLMCIGTMIECGDFLPVGSQVDANNAYTIRAAHKSIDLADGCEDISILLESFYVKIKAFEAMRKALMFVVSSKEEDVTQEYRDVACAAIESYEKAYISFIEGSTVRRTESEITP